MRFVIVGAGNAGRHLARTLCSLNHDVVLIDEREEPLQEVEAQLDIMTVQGQGSSPSVLDRAEIQKADLLVAVTNRDEVNILACAYAHACNVQHKVARVSNPAYAARNSRLDLHQLGVDLVVSHKEECAREIYNILRMPGTLEVVDLLGGSVVTVGFKVSTVSPLLRVSLREFPNPDWLACLRFIALVRGEEMLIPHGDTQIMIGDDLYVVMPPDKVVDFLDWAAPDHPKFDKVVIGGGGDLGLSLARRLEGLAMQVVLLERDAERAEFCSTELNRALVIRGDFLAQETLESAGIVDNTAFVAVAGEDEDNIISCLLAQKEGASFTLAQVIKPEYVSIINGLSLLDRVVSPHLAMINAILHFVRGRHVTHASLLHNLPGELIEITIPPGGKLTGKAIRDAKMPPGSIIAALLRNGEPLTPTGDLVLAAGDRVVLFALQKALGRLETLFGK